MRRVQVVFATISFLLLTFCNVACNSPESESGKNPDTEESPTVPEENIPIETGIIGKWEYVETQLTEDFSSKVLNHWIIDFREDGKYRNEVKVGPNSEMIELEDTYSVEGQVINRNTLNSVEVVELSGDKLVILSFGKKMTLKRI